MYLINKKKHFCFGCKACLEICPQKCISMISDNEGFLYPDVNRKKCTNCHLCETVCPINYEPIKNQDIEVMVGKHNSDNVIFESSSGGAFTAICDLLLDENYIVCGVGYQNLKVLHLFADNHTDCQAFKKSKYVLSDTNGCFTKIADKLIKGDKILFTGTPCQCAALRLFLNTKKIITDNLIIIDLVCHGAPNQELFDSYIAELEIHKKIKKFEFRNKIPINGEINSRSVYIGYSDDSCEIFDISQCSFLKGYHNRLFYRTACAKCKFAKRNRVGDLTIGDAWEIDKVYPEFDPLSGVSLILASSIKGKILLKKLEHNMILKPISIEWAMRYNDTLKRPTVFHKNRKKFFDLWKKKGFSYSVNKAIKKNIFRRILSRIKRLIILKG